MAKTKQNPTVSAAADADIRDCADSFSVDFESLKGAAVTSAVNTSKSIYMQMNPWFKREPVHTFEAAHIHSPEKELLCTLHLALDKKANRVCSVSEVSLDDYEYHAKRIIEEIRTDYALGKL